MSLQLSAEDVLNSNDLGLVREEVPEWPDSEGNPGVLYFRQLDAEEAMKLTDEMVGDLAKEGMFIMIVRTACDQNRKPVFTDADIQMLKRKSFRVLDRLQRVGLRVNSMLPVAEVALKKV